MELVNYINTHLMGIFTIRSLVDEIIINISHNNVPHFSATQNTNQFSGPARVM